MSRLIPASERIVQARALIQKARSLPVPEEPGRYDINYIAQVKAFLQQARDLIKFISYTPSASPAVKEEVKAIFKECDQTDQDLLRS
jgi:hypothetical protein